MTEEEIRAMIAAAFNDAAAEARNRVTEAGIQVDTAMAFVGDICEAVANNIASP